MRVFYAFKKNRKAWKYKKWEKSTNIRYLNYAEIIKFILENMQNIIFHFLFLSIQIHIKAHFCINIKNIYLTFCWYYGHD